MGTFLNRLDAAPLDNDKFSYPFNAWVSNLVDTLNEVIVDVQNGLNVIFPWRVVTGNTNMLAQNGYMTSSGATLDMLLPASASVGNIIRITNLGGNFRITQAIGQTVNFGDDTTTPGVAGSITSTRVGDSIEMVCYFPNTGFQVISCIGNFTVV